MAMIFNKSIFLLFLGGLFSLILSVVIIWLKQQHKRDVERVRLETIKEKNPEEVGDVNAKLDDSYEFRKFYIPELFAIWGLQPLFITCYVNLFTSYGILETCITFILFILILIHEFSTSLKYSKNLKYQIFILALWIISFFTISYRVNSLENNENKKKIYKISFEVTSPKLHQHI